MAKNNPSQNQGDARERVAQKGQDFEQTQQANSPNNKPLMSDRANVGSRRAEGDAFPTSIANEEDESLTSADQLSEDSDDSSMDREEDEDLR